MSQINIGDLLEKNIGNSIFSYEKIWKSMVPLTEKYCTYLSPDSRAYHSEINPLFTFQLDENSFKSFRIFSLLSLRDGVYPLLRFFSLTPIPHEIDPVLIVDSTLSSLVPMAWRERVFLRDLFTKTVSLVKKNELIILISPDKDNLPLEIVERELHKIKMKIETFDKVIIYFSSCNFMGEEDSDFDSSWGYKILKIFFMINPFINVTIIDFFEYQKLNFSATSFYFLNPLSFYFSDSFLLHDLLQRGSSPLEPVVLEGNHKAHVQISINHGFVFHQNFNSKCYQVDSFLKEKVFKGEIFRPSLEDDYASLKLSTKDFKDWSLHVALDIYQDKRL
jgi:hypothetical protein